MAEDKESAPVEQVLAFEQEVAQKPLLRKSLFDRIRELNRAQKILLALRGDRESRMVLLKSYDPQVYHFLCQNPRLTSEEVVELTKSDLLLPHTMELIARNREWIKNERIKFHLTLHPKAPTALALNMLALLSERSVPDVARNPYVKGALRKAALNKLQGRGQAASS